MSISKERGKTLLRLFVLFVLCSAVITIGIRNVYAGTTLVSVNPASIVDLTKTPGTTFTVDINVTNVANLYGGEFQVRYNPTLLENTLRVWGPVKTSRDPNVFVVDKSTVGNVWMVWTYLPPATAFTGNGTIATLTFKVLASDGAILDLHDSKLGDSGGNPIAHDEADGYFANVYVLMHTINWDVYTFKVRTACNSTVANLQFNQPEMEINFTVTGTTGKGFCNVTIPNDMIWGTFTVYLNSAPITFTLGAGNATHNSLWFTYTHSTQTIEIQGTEVVSEFPTGTAIAALMIITLLAVAIRKMAWTKKHRGPTIAE